MITPTSTVIEDCRMDIPVPEERDNRREEQNNVPTTIVVPLFAPPVSAAENHPEPGLPQEQRPAISSEAVSPLDKTDDTPPDYTRRRGSVASSLPSYRRATQEDSRTLMTEEERLALLQAFVEEKMYANDNFGGHKGVTNGPPNDPLKVFRWAKRKMAGEKDGVWSKLTSEQRAKWEAHEAGLEQAKGEVAWGDVDTHTIC
jgi:hypothetical protein